ncbi:MAG TPA: hypothetical protein PK400_01875 [Phycisphaerales bacterium]|nr:hypothetical protein [Phycisphaerales bacterium]HRQ74348.1 hypothetical protein [Phycisphaerales bacterium]
MKTLKRIVWPGVLFVLIGASVTMHVVMLIIINTNPVMIQDLRQIEQPTPVSMEQSSP